VGAHHVRAHINEFYGQTECNLVVGNGAVLPPVRPGWTGTAIPGHTVAIVDEEGRELPAGEWEAWPNRRPDPVMFLRYWKTRPPRSRSSAAIG